MDKINVELSDIIPFKEDNIWYLKLIYKYENKEGKHTVIIPKAAIPFNQKDLPSVHRPLYNNIFSYEPTVMDCRDSMILYKKKCDLAIKRDVKDPYYYFDIFLHFASFQQNDISQGQQRYVLSCRSSLALVYGGVWHAGGFHQWHHLCQCARYGDSE